MHSQTHYQSIDFEFLIIRHCREEENCVIGGNHFFSLVGQDISGVCRYSKVNYCQVRVYCRLSTSFQPVTRTFLKTILWDTKSYEHTTYTYTRAFPHTYIYIHSRQTHRYTSLGELRTQHTSGNKRNKHNGHIRILSERKSPSWNTHVAPARSPGGFRHHHTQHISGATLW